MNRRLLIPLGIGVVLVLLWFVALWGPQGSALSGARKRANDATQQGATLRDQLARLQQARRDQPNCYQSSCLHRLSVSLTDAEHKSEPQNVPQEHPVPTLATS